MIFTVISIFIALYALINFRKALMLFTIYQIFWYNTNLFSIGNFGLNTNFILPLYFALLYLVRRSKVKKCSISFPYKVPFLLIISSYVFSCFTASAGFTTELARSLVRVFSTYIYIWLLWNCIEGENDFKYLMKRITVVMGIGAAFGLYEYFTQSNPIIEYKILLPGSAISLYDPNSVRGYRLTSFFEHPIGAGMTFGLYSAFVLTLFLTKKEELPYKNLCAFIAFLCLPCVVLCKMRTAIIFTMISLLCVIKMQRLKKIQLLRMLFVFAILIPVLFIVLKNNSSLISNLFSTETSSEIGGSSLAMRLSQFEAIRLIVKDSILFGLGETFRNVLSVSSLTIAAKGFEGIIFEQLSMHGIYGLFVTAVLAFYSVLIIPKKYKSKNLFLFSLAYWLACLFSSIPSFRVLLLYLVFFYFIKNSNVYKSEKHLLDTMR